jgi:hypothetical protein
MIRFNIVPVLILLLVVFSQCKDVPETPRADFLIQKDAIVDGKRARIEVDKVNINEVVYFVSKSNAMFNCVWPGDSLLSGKIMVYRDYNLKKHQVNLGPFNKVDTTQVIKTTSYLGIALPLGTVELAHTFKSKGLLTVTWIATNSTAESSTSDILQKTITVE